MALNPLGLLLPACGVATNTTPNPQSGDMLRSPMWAGGHPAAATLAGHAVPIPGAPILAAAGGLCSGRGGTALAKWLCRAGRASGSAFDLRALTRFQMSRRTEGSPPPLRRGDNTSEPACVAAISLLYGALIAASHAARSRGLQKQRWPCNALCKESPAALSAHTRTCAATPQVPRQGVLLHHIFVPAAGSFW